MELGLMQREEHTLRAFFFLKKRVLRRVFDPKREGVAGGWRRLHNEGLHSCMLLQILLG
jgi:hypothetical protein